MRIEVRDRSNQIRDRHEAKETASGHARPFDGVEWALRLGVGLVFVGIGCEKVFPWPGSYWIKLFAEIGFGQWFMYLTGTLQIIGGVLMMVPWTEPAGAALLGSTMVGAILTHLFILKTGVGGALIPAGFLALIVFAVRRRYAAPTEAEPLDLHPRS
jgi:hypothetical protein